MKEKFYKIILIALVLFVNTTAFAQYNLLFLGDTTRVCDSILVDKLISEGYTLNIVAQNYFRDNYTVADSFIMYDALFVSEVISSDRANNYALTGFPIPCVCTEGYAVKANRWKLLTDDATQFHQQSSEEYTHDTKRMVIQNEDHYIVDKYGADYELTWTAVAEEDSVYGVTGCKLNEVVYEAIPLALYADEMMQEFPTMWAIPEGAYFESYPDVSVPNIITLGIIESGINLPSEEYFGLIQNSLKWVTGIYVDVKRINTKNNSLSVWPNPAIDHVNLSFTLNTSGEVKINIYDIAGKLSKSLKVDHMPAGVNNYNLELSGLTSAQYICEIVAPDDILRKRIVKQ